MEYSKAHKKSYRGDIIEHEAVVQVAPFAQLLVAGMRTAIVE